MQTETLVYGHKQGEPDYMEQLLLTHAETVKDLPGVLAMMRRDGWITRIAHFDGSAPDFTQVLKRKHK